MIYIKKEQNFIEIPRHSYMDGGIFQLQMVNNLTKNATFLDNLSNVNKDGLMYRFENLDFTKLEDGEYDYCLLFDDEIAELGIITVGNYIRKTNQYQNKVNKVQYNG